VNSDDGPLSAAPPSRGPSSESLQGRNARRSGQAAVVLADPVPNPASVDPEGLAKGIIAKITGADTARVLKPAWEVPNGGFVQFGCVIRTEKPGPFVTKSGPLVTEYRVIVNRTTKTAAMHPARGAATIEIDVAGKYRGGGGVDAQGAAARAR
jgi:hypothetical protein